MAAETGPDRQRDLLWCYTNPMLLMIGTLTCVLPLIGPHAQRFQPLWITGSWIIAFAQAVLSIKGYRRGNPRWRHHAASVGMTIAWSCIWVPCVIRICSGQAELGV